MWKLNNMWLISCNSLIKDCCSRRKVWKEKIWKWFSSKTGGHRKGKTCPGSHHIVNDIAGFLLFTQWAYEVRVQGRNICYFLMHKAITEIIDTISQHCVQLSDAPRNTNSTSPKVQICVLCKLLKIILRSRRYYLAFTSEETLNQT